MTDHDDLEKARAAILADGCLLLCCDCGPKIGFVKFLEKLRLWCAENGLDLVNVNSDACIMHSGQNIQNQHRNKILLQFMPSRLDLWREVARFAVSYPPLPAKIL